MKKRILLFVEMDECVLCGDLLSNGSQVVTLTEKGCVGIAKTIAVNKDNITVKPGQQVHKNCRRDYNRDGGRRRRKPADDKCPSFHSSEPTFCIKEHCLFCGTGDKYQGREGDHILVPVRTIYFQNTVRKKCQDRSDQWAETVLSRICFIPNLHAADAVYHQSCNINFRMFKQIPVCFQTSSNSCTKRRNFGQPVGADREEAFLKLVEDLEANDEELTTVEDFISQMDDPLQNSEYDIYGLTHMKEGLQKNFACDMNAFHIDATGPVEQQCIEPSQPVLGSQYSASSFATNNMNERTSSNTAKALVYANNRYNQGTTQNKAKMPIPIAPAPPARFTVSNTPTIFTVPASLFSSIMNNNAGCSGVNTTPVTTLGSGAPIASAMIAPQSSPSVLAPQPTPLIAQTPGKPLLAPKSSTTPQPTMNPVPSSNIITSTSSGTMISHTPGKPLLAPKTISSILTPITIPAIIAPKTTPNVIPPSSLQTVITPKTTPAVTLSTSAIVSPISATALVNPPIKPLLAPKTTPSIIPQSPTQSAIAPAPSSNLTSSPSPSTVINPSPGMPLIAPKPAPNILPASPLNPTVASALHTPSLSGVTPTLIAAQPSHILPTSSPGTTSCTTANSDFSIYSTSIFSSSSSLDLPGPSGTSSSISSSTSLPTPTSCKLEPDNSGTSLTDIRHLENLEGFYSDESDILKSQVYKLNLEKLLVEKMLAEEKLKFLRESHRMRVEEFEMRKIEHRIQMSSLKRKQEEAEEERKMRREEHKQKMQLLALQKEQLRNSQHEV